MRVRLVPLAEVFQRMPLAVRDAARHSGKEIRLLMEGTETEIDKILVERLLDPLLHLVRNAIAHGIGTTQERIAVGKPPEGTITLRGRPEGDHVVISIEDDGRGVDFEKIADQARSLGWLSEDHALNAEEILEIICRSGFSTKAEADLGAGRGVGMDVVLRSVNALGGRLDWQTTPGIGTTFFLRLPLTMVIIDAFIISAGGEQFAVPRNAVNTVIEIDPDQIVQVEKGELVAYYQSSLPLLRLADLFNLRESSIDQTLGSGRNILYGLVNGQETGQTALIVDKVMGLREVVVRPISDPLVAHPGIAGATELGDGRVILILDLPDLIRFAKQRQKKLKSLGK
jgi:two-component system chemotaxis sensor kinase CheA